MTVADYTETAFARLPRLHHKDALVGPSSAPFGRRNLVGMMGVMMSGGGAPAPWTPTENAYVQTDGVGWIDTGWTPSADGAYEIDLKFMATSALLGCMNAGAACRYYVTGNSRAIYYGNGGSTIALTNGPNMTVRAIRGVDNLNMTATNGTDTMSISGNNMSAMPNFVLGGRNYNGSVDNKGPVRIWSFEAWTNGVKVLSLWPREMDGVAGLWDTVNNVFVTATGGSLTYGISAT